MIPKESSKKAAYYEYDYARGKFRSAVYRLATGPGDVRSRLLSASSYIYTLMEDRFPKLLQKKWQKIEKGITRFGATYDHHGKERLSAIEHTMKRIKNSTGVALAEAICELSDDLNSYPG